jgi:predicted house-cleaning noncanonical NTP pyrophosphatase (MazG superfamily)
VKTDLQALFQQQIEFMKLLRSKNLFSEFPVDIATKQGQKLCKDIAHDAMDELHEAIQHLKNSKQHRVTEIKEFDREKYVEELVDHLHFFIELCVVSSVSVQELCDAYFKKGEVNISRVNAGY